MVACRVAHPLLEGVVSLLPQRVASAGSGGRALQGRLAVGTHTAGHGSSQAAVHCEGLAATRGSKLTRAGSRVVMSDPCDLYAVSKAWQACRSTARHSGLPLLPRLRNCCGLQPAHWCWQALLHRGGQTTAPAALHTTCPRGLVTSPAPSPPGAAVSQGWDHVFVRRPSN